MGGPTNSQIRADIEQHHVFSVELNLRAGEETVVRLKDPKVNGLENKATVVSLGSSKSQSPLKLASRELIGCRTDKVVELKILEI